MTKKERQQAVDTLIERNKKTPLYIKGYGENKCRVMTMDHHPVMNIRKEIVLTLIADGKIIQDGLIYRFA